jgi:outer membrane protein TolC
MSRFVALLLLAGLQARADGADPTLDEVVQQALTGKPELERVLAEVRAARERVPQVQAWADPMLQVGVQNDGFTRWNVGRMETSWVSLMATQTLPFPGKNPLRAEVAEREVRQRVIAAERVRLSTVADVRRAWLGLQVARARLEVLTRLSTVWEQARAIAQARYESAEGSQADLLRARLELTRLHHRRLVLELDERTSLEAINRLRRVPLSTPLASPGPLMALGFPPLPELAPTIADALRTSPELLAARAGLERVAAEKDLAGRLAFPDLTVGAGVMVRGALDPMWTVTVAVPVPVFSGQKQTHALTEAAALGEAATHELDGLAQRLTLETTQRLEAWRTLKDLWTTSEDEVLPQANASAQSTLGQYRAGRAPFSAVLEANATSLAEEDSALLELADAWKLAIATAEVSLDESAEAAR